MDAKFFTYLRKKINDQKGVDNYKINYNDNVLFSDEFKYFLGLNKNEESLLKVYNIINEYIKQFDDINYDLRLRELLNLNDNIKLDKINLFKYLNNNLIFL
tara:strand:- start:2120 stop:2422 length:303 start_codon:yes stop_codon:yes gene_type:complete